MAAKTTRKGCPESPQWVRAHDDVDLTFSEAFRSSLYSKAAMVIRPLIKYALIPFLLAISYLNIAEIALAGMYWDQCEKDPALPKVLLTLGLWGLLCRSILLINKLMIDNRIVFKTAIALHGVEVCLFVTEYILMVTDSGYVEFRPSAGESHCNKNLFMFVYVLGEVTSNVTKMFIIFLLGVLLYNTITTCRSRNNKKKSEHENFELGRSYLDQDPEDLEQNRRSYMFPL